MSKKQLKWKDIWKTQTELGMFFNLSSVAFGKKLDEFDLRDFKTKLPTTKSIDEGFCNNVVKKDGTVFYMWNRDKILDTFKIHGIERVSDNEKIVNSLIVDYRRYDKMLDEGNDKLGYMSLDCLFEEIPKHKLIEIKKLFVEKVKQLGLTEYYGLD